MSVEPALEGNFNPAKNKLSSFHQAMRVVSNS
jgi:hypothetical protein